MENQKNYIISNDTTKVMDNYLEMLNIVQNEIDNWKSSDESKRSEDYINQFIKNATDCMNAYASLLLQKIKGSLNNADRTSKTILI